MKLLHLLKRFGPSLVLIYFIYAIYVETGSSITILKNQAWYEFNHGRKGDNNGPMGVLLIIYFGATVGIMSLFVKPMREFTIFTTLFMTGLPLAIMIIYWSGNPPIVFFIKILISFLLSLIFLFIPDKKQELKIN
ncbi:MAG: hypothetical protein KBB91_01000 [Candidatus Pacebacteria bacterium]|nr:hypothetical protein [Candidatus Paceibacterota bacterium]MBP9701221.1 hypothetical protein [Candidatus Paceibacterota bacterium]